MEILPYSFSVIENMRDIGCSLQTAVADLIDSFIAAGAYNIELSADTTFPGQVTEILDDRTGMMEKELFEAMRFRTAICRVVFDGGLRKF